MYSSLSVLKRLILFHVLTIQLLLISSELPLNTTNAYLNHKCLVSQGKYKPGSEYEKHLDRIIKRFYSGSFRGYYLTGDSTGSSAILQCRGDSYGPKCHDCFNTAFAALRRRCPWYKGRIIWYDQCLFSIHGKDSTGQIDYDNNFCMFNAKKLGGDKLAFTRTWKTLMDNLTTLATTRSKDNYTKFSAGETWYKGDKVYGMAQCTYDLTRNACKECLVFNSLRFQDCLNDKRGARFVSGSCTFRFEFYPFISQPAYLTS